MEEHHQRHEHRCSDDMRRTLMVPATHAYPCCACHFKRTGVFPVLMIPARSKEKNNNGNDTIWGTPASFYKSSHPQILHGRPKSWFRWWTWFFLCNATKHDDGSHKRRNEVNLVAFESLYKPRSEILDVRQFWSKKFGSWSSSCSKFQHSLKRRRTAGDDAIWVCPPAFYGSQTSQLLHFLPKRWFRWWMWFFVTPHKRSELDLVAPKFLYQRESVTSGFKSPHSISKLMPCLKA